MKRLLSLFLNLIILIMLLSACESEQQTKDNFSYAGKNKGLPLKKSAKKKGILVVSFGTSYAKTRKITIEACEKRIARSFPEYQVRRAFTSKIIRRILKKRDNIKVYSTEEALEKMYADGFAVVIVQPLHILPGEEYHEKILRQAAPFKGAFKKLVVGRPILSNMNDFDNAVKALKYQLPKLKSKEAVILMGHGTHHPANAAYGLLQQKLAKQVRNVYIGTVEGYPTLKTIIPKLKKKKIKKVILMPYMVVAGDHAQNDMAGNEADSWKSILRKQGFKVKVYLKGLGENPKYQDIYIQNVKDCIQGHPMGKK